MQDILRIDTMDAAELAHLVFRTSVDRTQLQLMVLVGKLTTEQPMPPNVKHWDTLAGFAAEHASTDQKIFDRISKLAADAGHGTAAAMAEEARRLGVEDLKKLAREDVRLAEARGGFQLLFADIL